MNGTSAKGMEPYVMDEIDAATFMGISRKTLQTWRSRRMGPPYVRVARKCIRYRKSDLQAYLDERLVTA